MVVRDATGRKTLIQRPTVLFTLGNRMMFLECATHVIVVVIASRRAVP